MEKKKELYFFIKEISVRNYEEILSYLENTSFKCEKWLTDAVKEISNQHCVLRRDILQFGGNWTYTDYCNRLSYHFYNLASLYYNLYYNYKIDLKHVQKYIERCIRKVNEIPNADCEKDIRQLLADASSFNERICAILNEEFSKCCELKITSEYVDACLSLGNFLNDNVLCEHISKKANIISKQKFENILILRVIDILEDQLSIPIQKSNLVIVERFSYLSKLYKLAKYDIASDLYSNYINDILEESYSSDSISKNDLKKENIKDKIREEITKNLKTLDDINAAIETDFSINLLYSIDYAFIQRKYLKYCLEFWFEDTKYLIQKLIENKNFELLRNMFTHLSNINNFDDIISPINDLKSHGLLLAHINLISVIDQQKYLINFKNEFVNQFTSFCSTAKKEIIFMDAFAEFLNNFKHHNVITAELHLQLYFDNELTFAELVYLINRLDPNDYGENLSILQDSVNSLVELKLSLDETFKKIIKQFLQKVTITKRYIDGRYILEIKGQSIVLSDIKREIVTYPEVEEIRFVEAEVIHIDVDFSKDKWHGKNIVLYSKKIKIYGEIIWDISGLDNDHTYESDIGADSAGNGKRGFDGLAGESGGNVSIFAEEIDNIAKFTIVSNGGNGSKGQDGGNGKDGEDGTGLTKSEFLKKMPVFTKIIKTKRLPFFKKNINFIRSCPKIEVDWNLRKDKFLRAYTTENNQITMSFYFGFIGNFQGFCLYTGSFGKPGGKGGECGYGGQGGYGGEISGNINNLVIVNNNGQPGPTGGGGKYGYYGKNGWDIGYIDFELWFREKFYGENQNEKFSLRYYENSGPNRIYCPYRDVQLNRRDCYVEFVTHNIIQNKENKYDEREESHQKHELQHQAKATKKKSISDKSIQAQYSLNNLSLHKSLLHSIKSDINTTLQDAVNTVFKIHEQQEQYLAQVNVKRNAFYNKPNNQYFNVAEEINTSIKIPADEKCNSILNNINKNPKSKCFYLQLDSVHLSTEKLNFVNEIFENNKINLKTQYRNEIEDILIQKFQLNALEKISRILPIYEQKSQVNITAEEASRFLTKSKDKFFDISHEILGNITPYFFLNDENKRNNIIKFCTNLNEDDAEWLALQSSITRFILDQGVNCNASRIVKTYYEDFNRFSSMNDIMLTITFDAFEKMLKHYEYAYFLWHKSAKDKSYEDKFKREISKDKLLAYLYRQFSYCCQPNYNWFNCAKDPEVITEFCNYICELGSLAQCCLELISHIYKVNIRVYLQKKDENFVLIDNHNVDGKAVVYLLRQDNKYLKVDYEMDHFILDREYKIKNELYKEIIESVFSFGSKYKIDNYFKETKNSINRVENIHPTLNNLENYLFSDDKKHRQRLAKFLEKMSVIDRALHKSMKMLILTEGKRENETLPVIKQYYQNYIDNFETQKQKLLILMEPLSYEIMKHADIFTNTDKMDRNEKLNILFENDTLFKSIFKKSSQQLNKSYRWENCCRDKNILMKLKTIVVSKGVLNPCYRELLAFIYNVNIKVYIKKSTHFNLIYNHNPYAKKVIQVLQIKGKIVPVEKEELALLRFYETSNNISKMIEFFDLKEFDENLEDIFYNLNFSNSKITNVQDSMNEEANTIDEIIAFFKNNNEAQIVKMFLEKISIQYIGENTILKTLLKRFKFEGVHVTVNVLCQFINLILKFFIEDKNYLNIFDWIILSYSQNEWISEIILIQLENVFKKQLEAKEKWRLYLSNTVNKEIALLLSRKLYSEQSKITILCIDQILYLLSNIPDCYINLELVDLPVWPCALKEKYWETKLINLIQWHNNNSLYLSTYYILFIENKFGTDFIEKFITLISQKKHQLNQNILNEILTNLYNEKWLISDNQLGLLSNINIQIWIEKMNALFSVKDERKLNQLLRLVECNANTSGSIKNSLKKIEEKVKLSKPKSHLVDSKYISSFTDEDIRIWTKHFKLTPSTDNKLVKHEVILAIIDQAIFLKRKFYLRDTQKLIIMCLLTNQENTLAQVSTGEGKSLIVVAVSIIKCLLGEKVDIITSSSVLAKRDAKIYNDIYSLFNINVSHNCHEDIEKRKEVYSSNDIIYGNLGNFQRDFLLDRFYRINIIGDRNFYNVIIDEVDSMLLDKGNNILYLSHDLPGLDKLESLYLYIWQSMNRPVADLQELLKSMDKLALQAAIVHDIFGTILPKDLKKISNKLKEEDIIILYTRLVKFKVIDSDGKLLINDIAKININEIVSTEYHQFKDEVKFLIRETIEREQRIQIPNYLKDFVLRHLKSWINSAETALYLQENRDYVVDIDRTGTSTNMNPQITIIDKDTGTDQTNSQWDEVIHQFIQLKHGCKISIQSLKAVFISNVSYLKLYTKLYGLTGTLGSKSESQLLRTIHSVDFVTIPTAKPKKFTEYNPILCLTIEEMISKIICEVNTVVFKKKRSALIICETVDEAECLYKAFGGKKTKNLYLYTRDYEEFNIANGEEILRPGQIIVATNLSGRGTDIKLSEELKRAGGLHVCLTYLPKNCRIEQQAFGRAARCGDMGSGQLIMLSNLGKQFSSSELLYLKTNRDIAEAQRVSEIETLYKNQIKIEEKCFNSFKKQYENLKVTLLVNNTPEDIKEILLQSCLDNWAYWLDENGMLLNLTSKKVKTRFKTSFNEFINNMKKLSSADCKEWIYNIFKHYIPNSKKSYHKCSTESGWIQDPIELTKLGKCLAKNNYNSHAIDIYNIVINREPNFSESAHYNKAYSLAKSYNWENGLSATELLEFKTELREAKRLFLKHCEFCTTAASIVAKIKNNTYTNMIQINAYEDQKKCIYNYYFQLIQSIDDILGTSITPQSFIGEDINEDFAETIYEDLLNTHIVERLKINNYYFESNLQTLAYSYGTTTQKLKSFLSNYFDKPINEKGFHKELKKHIVLPNKEDFWKVLKENNVLINEIKYVIINKKILKVVDPSLLILIEHKIANRKIHEYSFSCNSTDNIYLYTSGQLQEKNESNIIIEERVLKELVNDKKYKSLKNKGTFTKNKRASINGKIEINTLPAFDSITVEDFAKEGISETTALNILNELTKDNVLKMYNNTYKLNIDYKQIRDLELRSFRVYENTVISLLDLCFIYRIACQKLEEQLKKSINHSEISIQLMSKPYTNIVMEMIDLGIVKNSKIKNKSNELDNVLKKLYKKHLLFLDLKHILSRHNIIDSKIISNNLYEELKNKCWIVHHGKQQFESFTINEKMDSKLDSSFDYVEETIRLYLANQCNMSKLDTIQRISNILEQSISVLLSLDIPDPEFESINENNLRNIHVEEIHLFNLIGLDEIIKFKEKKWTPMMICSTIAVIIIGIVHIIIGAIIELYSVGVLTHVACGFISEGVSDILYALGSLHSGYFSWKDYGKHKLYSIAMTALMSGIGAYVSKGVKVSRLGYKVAGPAAEFGEKRIAETTGKELCKALSGKVVLKEVGKRISIKTIEGIAYGAANVGVDMLVENCLKKFCDNISYTLLSDIENQINEHAISKTLENTYIYLGLERTKELVNNVIDKYFKEKSITERLGPATSKIANSVIQGIVLASKKMSKIEANMDLPINMIIQIITWAGRAINIIDLIFLIKTFMNDLNDRLKEKCSKIKEKEKLTSKITLDQQFNILKIEINEKWKSNLRDKISQVITQNMVNPILKDGAYFLLRYVGKSIQKTYNECEEYEYSKKFKERKQQYLRELESIDQEHEERCHLETDIKAHYHKDLLKIMQKTKNPKLFVAIIKENIPMDITCVASCTQIIHRILETQGIWGVKIIVSEENGFKQEFSSTGDNNEQVLVDLTLKDSHFELINTTGSIGSSGENNCLFDALSKHILQLSDMTPEMFRDQIVNQIENDVCIQNHIQRGWHKIAILHSAVGGGRHIREGISINEINKVIENDNNNPNSGYVKEGCYMYDSKQDVDLRESGTLSVEQLHKQRADGFKIALGKINERLAEIQKGIKNPIFIHEGMFETIVSDRVLMRTKFGNVEVGVCPVEMQTKVLVNTKIGNVNHTKKLTLEINIDNPDSYYVEHGPRGSHIGYEISGLGKTKGGHILLNKEGNLYMPRRERNTKLTRDFKPETRIEEAGWKRQIPPTRMFSVPSRPNAKLYRVDTFYVDEIDQVDKRIRRNSFTSSNL